VTVAVETGGWIAFAYLGPLDDVQILAGPVSTKDEVLALGARAFREAADLSVLGARWYVSQGSTNTRDAEHIG